jgi:LysM repeat protein
MKKGSLLILTCLLLTAPAVFAQNSSVIRNYIERYREIAIDEEIRTGVPAAITLAQGIHESSAGQSDLVSRSNNHFGIKCKSEWAGEKVYHDDDARGECFRKYDDPEQSYRDHSDFLKNRSPYVALFRLEPTDFEGWAYGLKKAGYATNPKYPQILIRIIRDYNLNDFTLMALGKKPRMDQSTASTTPAKDDVQFAVQTAAVAVTTPARPAYPSGIFKINEASVIFVTKGTVFADVAGQHDLSTNSLFDFNDMKPQDVADRDQLVYLQRKRRGGSTDLHQALEGESLWDVAQEEGVRLEALLDYNGLGYNRSFVAGELIALSGKASKPVFATTNNKPEQPEAQTPPPASVSTAEAFIRHRVQPKETLFSLSKKYGVGVEDIKQWNNLPTSDLKVGQEVRIKKSS